MAINIKGWTCIHRVSGTRILKKAAYKHVIYWEFKKRRVCIDVRKKWIAFDREDYHIYLFPFLKPSFCEGCGFMCNICELGSINLYTWLVMAYISGAQGSLWNIGSVRYRVMERWGLSNECYLGLNDENLNKKLIFCTISERTDCPMKTYIQFRISRTITDPPDYIQKKGGVWCSTPGILFVNAKLQK